MDRLRIYYIDYIKAFSISLIIASHCLGWYKVNDPVNVYILSIHVPIFFIAIGVLKAHISTEKTSVFIKKRVRSLLIPYFFFSIYNSVVKLFVLYIEGNLTSSKLHDEIIEFFITGNGTVWFLMTLFLAETLYVYLSSRLGVWLFVAAVIMLLIPSIVQTDNPFGIVVGRAMLAFFFIVYGYYLKVLIIDKIDRYSKIALSTILLCSWIYLVHNTSWEYSLFYGNFSNPKASIPTILAGTTFFILLFSFIKKNYKVWNYIGKNSLILMLVHPTFLLIGIYGIRNKLFSPDTEPMQIVFTICLFAGVYLLSILCIPIINNYFPFLIGKKREIHNSPIC